MEMWAGPLLIVVAMAAYGVGVLVEQGRQFRIRAAVAKARREGRTGP